MIEINLLPQEYRKKEPRFKGVDLSQLSLQKIPVMHIIVGVVVALVAAQAIVLALGFYGRSRLVVYTKRYAELQPAKKEYDALKARAAEEARKIAAIDELMVKRFSWACKLNQLSDTITPGIWLSELAYDERSIEKYVPQPGAKPAEGTSGPALVKKMATERALTLTGYAAAAGEQGAALVGKFIKSMKETSDFSKDLKEIVLGFTRSDRAEGQEVNAFKISCIFKES